MTFEELRQYLLNKPEAEEGSAFGPDTFVYKLKNKVFAILFINNDKDKAKSIGTGSGVNLKCNPDQSIGLRDVFDGITSGYHMNKKNWNTIKLASDVPNGEIYRLVDHSYSLIFSSLKKIDKKHLQLHYSKVQLSLDS